MNSRRPYNRVLSYEADARRFVVTSPDYPLITAHSSNSPVDALRFFDEAIVEAALGVPGWVFRPEAK